MARYLLEGMPKETPRALFLGCATGVNDALPFARLASSVIRILAGDVEESYLGRLREHLRGKRLRNLEARRIDITKDLSSLGTFGVVTLFFVIHRLKQWRPVIPRLANLVERGGSLYVSEFTGPSGLIYLANEGGGKAQNPVARLFRRYFELVPRKEEPELKSDSIGPVLKELARIFEPFGTLEVAWRQTPSVGEALEKIEKGVFAPFRERGRQEGVLVQLRREFDGERSRRANLVERIRIYRFLNPRRNRS